MINIERMSNSYRDFLSRFDINCNSEEPVWAILSKNGWTDYTSNPDNFSNILSHQLNQLNGDSYHIYRATGTLRKGSIKLEGNRIVGRNADNLERILEIALDADYITYLCYIKHVDHRDPKSKQSIEKYIAKLHSLSNDELTKYLKKYLELIMETLTKAGIPYSEITYSGYGFYVKIYIAPEDQYRIPEIRGYHKDLVSYLNKWAGFELFDRQCTDAGTRVTRIEGSYNLKNPQLPRLVRCVKSNGIFYKLDNLLALVPKEKREYIHEPIINKAHEGNFPRNEIIAIVNPYYTEGERQNVSLSVSGFVAKEGGTLEDAKYIISMLIERNSDNESSQRIAAVESTFKKIKEGKPVKGYKGLEQLLTEEALTEIRKLFRTSPIFVETAENEPLTDDGSIPKFPGEAYTGIFKEYVERVGEHSETPKQFHFSTFSSYFGLRLGRDIWTPYPRPLYPNLYVCNVSTTGDKKTTGIGYLYDFSEDIPQDKLQIVSGISSPEGIINLYSEAIDNKTRIPIPEKQLLIIQNELTSILKKGDRQSTSTLHEMLNDLYDYLPFIDIPTRANPLRAETPCFGIIAATTPGAFERVVTEYHIRMGMLNRFSFFIGKVDKPIASPIMPDIFSIKGSIDKILSFASELRENNNNRIDFTPEAFRKWEEYYNDLFYDRQKLSELEIAISARAHVFAVKFSMLYAMGNRQHFVDLEDLYYACLIADYLKDTALYVIGRMGETKYTKLEERLLNFFRENKGKFFPYGSLRSIAGGYYKRREVLIALNTLVDTGEIQKRQMGVTDYYGKV